MVVSNTVKHRLRVCLASLSSVSSLTNRRIFSKEKCSGGCESSGLEPVWLFVLKWHGHCMVTWSEYGQRSIARWSPSCLHILILPTACNSNSYSYTFQCANTPLFCPKWTEETVSFENEKPSILSKVDN